MDQQILVQELKSFSPSKICVIYLMCIMNYYVLKHSMWKHANNFENEKRHFSTFLFLLNPETHPPNISIKRDKTNKRKGDKHHY